VELSQKQIDVERLFGIWLKEVNVLQNLEACVRLLEVQLDNARRLAEHQKVVVKDAKYNYDLSTTESPL